MAAKIGLLYFNELDFRMPPVLVEEGEYSHNKEITRTVPLNVPGNGRYTFQVNMRKSQDGRLYMTLSLYDDQILLVDRREMPMAELLTAYQENGLEGLSEIVMPMAYKWIAENNDDFRDLLLDSIVKVFGDLQKAEDNKDPSKGKKSNVAALPHRYYHLHRLNAA